MKAGVVMLSLFLVVAFTCVGLAQQSGSVDSKTDEMSALAWAGRNTF